MVDTYFISGSLTSSKFIVKKTTADLCAHITGGGGLESEVKCHLVNVNCNYTKNI